MLHRLFSNMRSIALAATSMEENEAVNEAPSLLEELWTYIIEKYLTPNFGAYENIDINYDPLVPPYLIFFAGLIAVVLGASTVIFNRRTLGRLVRRILRNKAHDPQSAMTLEELGLSDSKAVKWFINGTTLAKAVRCREEDEHYGIEYVPVPMVDYSGKEEDGEDPIPAETTEDRAKNAYYVSINTPKKLRYKRDPLKDHFYIPEHKRHHARVRFNAKGTNPLSVVILAVVYIVLGVIFIQNLPAILSVVDGMISGAKS